MAAQFVVPSAALEKVLTKQLGVCRSHGPQVEYFQQLAEACPSIVEQVNEYAEMHAALDNLCRVGLGGNVADLGEASRG